MRAKRWILAGAGAFSLACAIWVVLSLRNDDSTLSVVTRYLRDEICWSADSNLLCVLRRMAKDERKGRYENAISTGLAWTRKHPDGFESGLIYRDLSVLYLKRARMDSGHAEEHLKQAIFYRDKELPSASDSPYALQPLEAISEAVGDLSADQRCVQYRNSIKLVNRMNFLVTEDKGRLARQFKPDPVEREQIECLSEWIESTTRRVEAKLATAGCR